MDGLELLLRERYCPDTLPELLNGPVSDDINKAIPSPGLVAKAANTASQKVVVLMNANDFSEDLILNCCQSFNKQCPSQMGRSYTLPAAWGDIPANSWIMILDEYE